MTGGTAREAAFASAWGSTVSDDAVIEDRSGITDSHPSQNPLPSDFYADRGKRNLVQGPDPIDGERRP